MNTIIRTACAVNKVKVAMPEENLENILELVNYTRDNPADIIVFPSLAMSSPSCGGLFNNAVLTEGSMEQLENFTLLTQNISSIFIVGLPYQDNGAVVSVNAVIHKGKIVALVHGQRDYKGVLTENFSTEILPSNTLFSIGGIKFCILSCTPEHLYSQMIEISQTGCDLVILPSYMPVSTGYISSVTEIARLTSKIYGCGVMIVNGGVGDSSSTQVYRGFSVVAECGVVLGSNVYDTQDVSLCDIDCDIIAGSKIIKGNKIPIYKAAAVGGKKKLLRPLAQNPYLPQDINKAEEYLKETFKLQCIALKSRMENTEIKKIVVGLSGGLDSTLAILCAVEVMDILGFDRDNIIAITMPGFATSDRTYLNALALIECLGVSGREIPIKESVMQHFQDISHNHADKNITYENAQARERTQILFDIANDIHALVLGTGDLSEIALGWCTFGGDHLSGYNPNASLTKTMVKDVCKYIADKDIFIDASDIIKDIIDTPVSPELVSTETGEITQKTEDILGPYILHEFFLYYLVKYSFRPSKIYYYALFAFSGVYDPDFIKDKLTLFLKRFVFSQFKRSCSPDYPQIGEIDLSSFYMPSDLSPDVLVKELGTVSF